MEASALSLGNLQTYQVNGSWSGDKYSVGHIKSAALSTEVSIPENLNGPGVGSNPEELLLAAAASCYLITLSAILSNRKVSYLRIELSSEAFMENDKGLRLDRIVHRPTIIVDDTHPEVDVATLALHAEHACMVSSALRGNVSVDVEPQIVVQAKQS